MKFTVLAIGKLKEQYLRDGVAEFTKRLRVYGGVTITELPESKMSGSGDTAARLQAVNDEGERLLKGIANNAYVVLLDVYGKTTSSEALAARIADLEVRGTSEMVFIIGGAFGVSEALRRRADWRLSFSPMTFTHQMVRLLLIEQLYRACKINRHEPYHW